VLFAISKMGEAAFLDSATASDPAVSLVEALSKRLRPERAGNREKGAPLSVSDVEDVWRAWLPPPAAPRVRAAPAGFQRGVCLAHTNSPDGGYGSDSLGRTLDHLASDGVEWISVTPFGFQRTRDSTRIGYVLAGPGSETDEVMRHVIREAHARGLKMLYNPHMWVGHWDWTGDIEMKDEGDWAAWFDSYRRFIVHHAILAEEERAEIFSVANELGGTVRRERQWRETLAAVRKVFGGPLTYAANWGEEVERIAFWDGLDFVGVNAYYPLSADPDASEEDLAAGANVIAGRLSRIGRVAGRPILLTEVGFASRPGSWVDPHREVRDATPDVTAQARSYRAVLGAFTTEPFRGLYWWKFESDPHITRAGDSSFTPQGKPAEDTMAEAYRRLARSGRPSSNGPGARN
jgi:hypothetical protein